MHGPERAGALRHREHLAAVQVLDDLGISMRRGELVEPEPEVANAEPPMVRAPAVAFVIRVVPFVGEDVHATSFGSSSSATAGSCCRLLWSGTAASSRTHSSLRASRSRSRACNVVS